MADFYWVGPPGQQSWNVSANWSSTEGGTGGAGVPGALGTGDNAYIRGDYESLISGFTVANSLATLEVNFNGSIGSQAVPLVVTVSAALRIQGGLKGLYISPTQATSAATIAIGSLYCPVFISGGTLRGPVYLVNCQVIVGAAVTYSGSSVSLDVQGGSCTVAKTASTDKPTIRCAKRAFVETAETMLNGYSVLGTLKTVGSAGATLVEVDDVLKINSSGTFTTVRNRGGIVNDYGNPFNTNITDYIQVGVGYSDVKSAPTSETIILPPNTI